MRWRGRVRQARARGKRHHPDRPGAGQRWLAGDAPDLRGQSLGLLLGSGEQAWQTRATIADPLALPAPEQPLLWLLGAALLGGLILNLMPCVLPVLALKLGTVLQQREREQGGVRKQFLAASAGIITSFWVLAAMSSLLRATQGAVGWGSSSRAPVSSASWWR